MAVADVVRSGQPGYAVPGQTVGLQLLPGQGVVHDLVARTGGQPPGRSVAAFGGRPIPPGYLLATPANAPDHLPHRSAQEDSIAAAIDRYSTQWGSRSSKEREAK